MLAEQRNRKASGTCRTAEPWTEEDACVVGGIGEFVLPHFKYPGIGSVSSGHQGSLRDREIVRSKPEEPSSRLRYGCVTSILSAGIEPNPPSLKKNSHGGSPLDLTLLSQKVPNRVSSVIQLAACAPCCHRRWPLVLAVNTAA